MRKNILGYIACIVLLVQGARSGGAKCKRPNGLEGDVRVEGCEQLTCTAISARKGIWIPGPAV